MKQFLRSFLTLLMLVVWASGFAAEKTYSYTFVKGGTFTEKNQTKTFNDVEWTISTDAGYFTFYNSAQQIGSKNNPGKNTTISTSDFSGTIKSVKVNGWNSNDAAAKVEILVGEISYGSQSFTTKSNDYNFTGTSTGTVSIKIDNNADGAFYIKTISVTYEEGPTKTATTLTFPETAISINGGDEASFKGQSAKLYAGKQELTDKTIKYAHTGNDIFATFDETTGAATLKSGVYGTATVTATYAGDDTYEEAKASYTVKIVDPNASEVTFDFSDCTKYGYNKPISNNKRTELEIGDVIKSSPITITVMACGSTKNGFGTTYLGVYEEGVLKIEIEKGYVLNEVSFERKGSNNTLTINDKKAGETWTGEASFVTLSVPDGAKGTQVTSITIKYSKTTVSTPLTLDENADDTNTKIEANNGKTIDVKLTRSLKAGVWNTICLPFNVTAEQVESVLKATGNVKEFDKEDKATATIFFKPATEMKAGVPYLIKPTEDATVLNFKDVTINNVDELSRINGNDYCICGVFGKTKLRTTGTDLFLNAAGKFVAPAPGKETMKGFRAYFNVPSNASAAALNINIDGETTGINSIETEATVNGKVYNLNGQYVGNSLNGLKKGIYVVNGKKVIK